MAKNRSVPDASVIPVLAYPDVAAAVEFLTKAFGFKERLRIGDHRAQLVYRNGAVIATDRGGAHGDASHSVLVRIDDADAHRAQAEAAGARILDEPTDYPYGERQYDAEDIGGHRWTFSQTIADVDPADWGGTPVDG